MVGTVTVVDQQGGSRELEAGDQIQPGEKIIANSGSGVMLLLPDGKMLPIGNVPAVQSTVDEGIASLEDQLVKSPLVQGEADALISKAESTDKDTSDAARHTDNEDKPVSSSITKESIIEMDLTQVNPDLNAATSNPAGMDFSEFTDDATGAGSQSAGSHSSTGSSTASLQPVFVNFVPVLTGDIAGRVHEDVHLTSTGALNISNRNIGDLDTVTLNNGNGTCGTLAIDQLGRLW